jgi:hypothetical protein
MKNSAASTKIASTIAYLPPRDIAAKMVEQSPIRFPWTDELERRRRAVARWRGDDTGLKETMMPK